MKRLQILAVLALFFIAVSARGQEDAWTEFSRQYEKNKTDFIEKRKQANAEFVNYLAAAWQEFQIQYQKKNPFENLPEDPVYYNSSESKTGTFHGIPAPETGAFSIKSVAKKISAIYQAEAHQVKIDFFGTEYILPFPDEMLLENVGSGENEASSAWEKMSAADYYPILDAIRTIQQHDALNDWAVYQIIKALTDAVYDDYHINEAVMTIVYLMNQMEYKVKAASSDNQLLLLMPFLEDVYQVPYIQIDGCDYAVYSRQKILPESALYTYPQDFAIAGRGLSLKIDTHMKLGNDSSYISVHLPLWSEILKRDISIPVNKAYIDFTYQYPQVELPVYHLSIVDTHTSKKLLNEVRYQILKEKYDRKEALSLILNLVQRGFDYKTDYEMFGRVKPLFVEESVFYGANNCKDRALVFTWMVRNLLKLETILVAYPGHLACGVGIENLSIDGDRIVDGDKEYIMCDPTYINAPVGMTMPQFQNVKPKIMRIQ